MAILADCRIVELKLKQNERNGNCSFQKSEVFRWSGSDCYLKVYYGWEDNVRKVKVDLISKPALSEEIYMTVTLFNDDYEIHYPKTLIQDPRKCISSYPCSDIEKQLHSTCKWNFGFRFELEKASSARSQSDLYMEPNIDQNISGTYGVPISQVRTSQCLTEAYSLEKLSEAMKRLLDTDTYTDVVLKCGDVYVKSHKAVLGTRSGWFEEKFLSKTEKVIDLSFLDLDVFRAILNYVYTGKFPDLSFEMAKKLYEAGDLCDIGCLKQKCVEFLIKNLTPDNACECLAIADEDFKDDVIKYIIDEKIYCNDEHWQPFCERYPHAANSVLNKLLGQRYKK